MESKTNNSVVVTTDYEKGSRINKTEKNNKRNFKLPHLLFLMLGLLVFTSLLTYIVPAGQFVTDPNTGAIIGSEFSLLEVQTPVNPWQAVCSILDGFKISGQIIAVLFLCGGTVGIILGTRAIDDMLDFSIYKLKDKGINILIPGVFVIFSLLGAFSSADQVIAMIPIGMLLAKKLRVDPFVGILVTLWAVGVGYISAPTGAMIPQAMMGVPVFSGIGMRMIMWAIFTVIGIFFTRRYATGVLKDPNTSVLGKGEWYNELDQNDNTEIKKVDFKWKSVLIVCIFFSQYIAIVVGVVLFRQSMSILAGVMLFASIACGVIAGMSLDDMGKCFEKGVQTMAFVCALIGFASAMSIVMMKGNILHTIVYYLSSPLKGFGIGGSAVGLTMIISVINLLIPSGAAKAAIFIPIIQPMCETLGLTSQVGVTLFKYGDSITNMITPFLAVFVGGLAIAKVPFGKYVKWVAPKVVLFLLIAFIHSYIVAKMGWTGL